MPEQDPNWEREMQRLRELKNGLQSVIEEAHGEVLAQWDCAAEALEEGCRELDRLDKRTRRPRNRLRSAFEDLWEEAQRAARRLRT